MAEVMYSTGPNASCLNLFSPKFRDSLKNLDFVFVCKNMISRGFSQQLTTPLARLETQRFDEFR